MRWHKNGSNTVIYMIETKHKLCKIRIILRSNIDSVLYLGFASKSSNFPLCNIGRNITIREGYLLLLATQSYYCNWN